MARPSTNPLQLVYGLPRFYAGLCFFVDSTNGSYSYSGLDPKTPLRSINAAVAKCVADRDDVILVLAGYNNLNTSTETGGDDVIDLDVDGITVLSCSKNVTVQAIASGGSIFTIGADRVTLGALPGCQWMAIDAVAGTTSTVVEIETGSVGCDVGWINTGPGTTMGNYDELITVAATAHGSYIHDCRFIGDATDTDEGIMIQGTVDGLRVERVTLIDCNTGSAQIYSNSVHTNCLIKDCLLVSATASKYGINFNGASATGLLVGNRIMVADEAKGCVNQLCYELDQWINDAATTQGGIVPAGATVTSDRRAKLEIVYLKAA